MSCTGPLSYVDDFWGGPKQLELLLTHRGRRERLLATCVRGTPAECQRRLLEHGCGSLYENIKTLGRGVPFLQGLGVRLYLYAMSLAKRNINS